MTNALSPRKMTTIALAGSLLAIVVSALLGLPGAAHAAEPTGYGELTRFGETGDLKGQLDETRTLAIGADPTDNSVYVLDENKAGTSKKRFLRLQKFGASGEQYVLKASKEFSEEAREENGHVEPTVQGLAVDPTLKRVYLLAVDIREKALSRDATTRGGQGLLVATTLYAFSTAESGSELVEATGTKPGGILDGPTELDAQSTVAGQALLEPHGITVDPATGEVIILAHEDSSAEGEKEDKITSAADHYVLQRITSTGALGTRYVDSTNFLKGEQSPERFPVPNSPTVVAAGGKEHVFFGFDQGLVEVPFDFTSSTPPKLIPSPEGGVAGGIEPFENGGAISSAEGTVFGTNSSGIINQEPGGEGRGGVVAYSGETGAELGWTGGAQQRESEPKDKCVLSQRNVSLQPLVAAGSAGKLFVLDPEFLLRQVEIEPLYEEVENPVGSEEFEIIETPQFEQFSPPFFPGVVELGPGGVGCPTASATPPTARVNGTEVKDEESVKPGSEVIFSSQLKQADALKVEWNFGDGSKQTISTDEFEATSAKHTYTSEGMFTVTETIYSDDLAASGQAVYTGGHLTTPTISVTRTIFVGKNPPKAVFTSTTAHVGEATQFTSHSTDPNGAEGQPLTATWNFGDGSPAATGTTQSHSYAAAGTYQVTLTVTDKFGLKNSVTQPVTVSAPQATTPAPGGGGGGGGGSGTGSTSSTTTPTTTTPSGKVGVLSYVVSLASSTLSVSKLGALVIKVNCSGQSSCTGSAVLRTASAVSASTGKGAHKTILTLASGSFAIAGGQVKALTLHLTSKARSLLKRLHSLRAKVSIVAHDTSGAAHSTTLLVTLRLAKSHH
jgi:PKD repeat protein